MKSVAIIQARMGSTRFPGKVLSLISGRPMLAIILDRVRQAQEVEGIVVATSRKAENDAIAELVDSTDGVTLFRGPEDDVLERYWQAASQLDTDIILRVTADNPLFDPPTADRLIRLVRDGCDFATNNLVPSFPYGIDLEAFTMEALEIARAEARTSDEREHVSPFIRNHGERFRLCGIRLDQDWSAVRLTVDTPADLEHVRSIFERHGPGVRYQDVIPDD